MKRLKVMMNKLILIDAQNLAHRFFWRYMKNKREPGSSLHYGSDHTSILFSLIRELILIEKSYPNSDKIVVWDSSSIRRKAETTKAKEIGLIKTGYKEGRVPMKDSEKESLENQIAHLQTEILPNLGVMQVYIQGFEADDCIYAYTVKYPERECVIISSDRDFYQCLGEKVIVHDTMKEEVWTQDRFKKDYGFNPSLYVDYGALVGEGSGGDNIPGVDGCGDVSARKLVQAYGNIDGILKALSLKENRTKLEDKILASVDVIALSYSLKKMDVLNLPDLQIEKKTERAVKQLLIEWGCMSMMKDAKRLCGGII